MSTVFPSTHVGSHLNVIGPEDASNAGEETEGYVYSWAAVQTSVLTDGIDSEDREEVSVPFVPSIPPSLRRP